MSHHSHASCNKCRVAKDKAKSEEAMRRVMELKDVGMPIERIAKELGRTEGSIRAIVVAATTGQAGMGLVSHPSIMHKPPARVLSQMRNMTQSEIDLMTSIGEWELPDWFELKG